MPASSTIVGFVDAGPVLFTPDAFTHSPRPAAALAAAANQLAALILEQESLPLTDPEEALLHQWLRALTGGGRTAT